MTQGLGSVPSAGPGSLKYGTAAHHGAVAALLRVTLDERGQSPKDSLRYDVPTHWRMTEDGLGLEVILEHERGHQGSAALGAPVGPPGLCCFSVRALEHDGVRLSLRSMGAPSDPGWQAWPESSMPHALGAVLVSLEGTRAGFFGFQIRDATNGQVLVETCSMDLNVGSALQSAPLQHGPSGWVLALALEEDFVLYGLGEDFGPFVKNARRRALVNADALGNHEEFVYQNAPFLVSHTGWSLEVEGDAPCIVDVGGRRHGILEITQDALELSVHVKHANGPVAAVRALRNRQQSPLGVPDWSFGLWMSRCYYKDEDEIRSVLNDADRHGVSLGTINLDARCWMRPTHRTDFVPDPERYPDFFGLLADIRQQGVEVCLWENPYVSSLSELYDEGVDCGYFVKDAKGQTYPYQWVPTGLAGFPQTPVSGLVDFTNPDAVTWWQKQHEPFLKAGVKCFKTDFGEEIPWDACFFDGRSGFAMRNHYSDCYNLAVLGVLRDFYGDEGIIWARSGYRHTQATPVKWAGDGQTDWRSLRATLRAGLSQAFGGALFWSHDVGGFYGPMPDDDLYLRWAQMGLWGSHVRCHGTTPREPWAFGSETLDGFRLALKVRLALREYFLWSYRWCLETGQSFMRPLVLCHEAPMAARWVDDAFFAGPDVIVAPFLKPRGGREIVLPQGRWFDLCSGDLTQGPCEMVIARHAYTPVFVREDSKHMGAFRSAHRLLADHRRGVGATP